MNTIQETEAGLILNLRVIPRASKTEFAGTLDDALKIRLQAPPVDGKANKALIKFLAKQLAIPARDIEILSGQTGRTKRVLLRGRTASDVHLAP